MAKKKQQSLELSELISVLKEIRDALYTHKPNYWDTLYTQPTYCPWTVPTLPVPPYQSYQNYPITSTTQQELQDR